ncbi:MAG: asparaginase [Oligoflexia bacterium]|nr:asparaginase [Oligoflexia bacterium]
MKNILILHTGGTIGMVPQKDKKGALVLTKNAQHFLELVPELKKIAKIQVEVLDDLDSSNVTPTHWIKWLKTLRFHYKKYDGFIFTHGTDSMAYTGSAFSFALGQIDKPIVLTGSQRPLSVIRTDARDNLINSVEMACRGPKEVTLCFGNQLLRANRSTKFSATDYIAFESFNFPRLAQIGVEVESNWQNFSAKEIVKPGKPLWQTNFNEKVFCFKIFPGISSEILLSTINNKACEGIVLEAFGSGNVPSIDDSVLAMIRRAQQLGKPVVIVSQCPHGRVNLDLYDCGVKAKKAGAISAGDMTREAAVVKLMHSLGLGLKGSKLRAYFLKNICGERSL